MSIMYKGYVPIKMFTATNALYIQILITIKTQDPNYSAEKRNNIVLNKISLNMHFSAIGFVNGTHTFVS